MIQEIERIKNCVVVTSIATLRLECQIQMGIRGVTRVAGQTQKLIGLHRVTFFHPDTAGLQVQIDVLEVDFICI